MTQPNIQSAGGQTRNRGQEAGVALLIAIFTLLIVSAAALALVLSSGTESSLAANYRSSTSVYYAGLAGLEEARGRLLPSNPDFFNATFPNFVTLAGQTPTLPVGQVRYIVNQLPGEVVAPATVGNKYYDNEYQKEWGGVAVPAAATLTIPSVSTQAGIQGPMFKWVRITAATEQSLNLDIANDNNGDWLIPNQIFYDPAHLNAQNNPAPSLIVPPLLGPPSTASQVFQIATLAVLPNGTQKIMEYVVTPETFNLNMPSALTLPGPLGSFNPPNSANYCIDGNDTSQSAAVPGCAKFTPPPAVPGCNTTVASTPAIGVSPGNDNSGGQTNVNYVQTQIPRPANYTGSTGTTPSVGTPALPPALASPAQLQQELSVIAQNSNVCLASSLAAANTAQCPNPTIASPPYSYSQIVNAQGSLWAGGANQSTTPQVTYVDGDLDISGKTSGSGILVVTGNLTYSGDSSWNGIILVIGAGLTTYTQNGAGSGQFNGAIFVANTNGNPPGTYGPADFTINGGGGNGLYYNSCWIKNSQKPITLKVLSFREISN